MVSTYSLLAILGIGAIFFGAKKLPELGKGIGEGIREFRKSMAASNDSKKAGIQSASIVNKEEGSS